MSEAKTQLTLGEIIERLKVQNIGNKVRFDFDDVSPVSLESWRGSYADLAIGYEKGDGWIVSMLLGKCKEAVGKTFEGYKGGDFEMSKKTDVWVSNFGEYESVAIFDILEIGGITILRTFEVDY